MSKRGFTLFWFDEDGDVVPGDESYGDEDEAVAMAALVARDTGSEVVVTRPVGRGPHVKAIARVNVEDLRG